MLGVSREDYLRVSAYQMAVQHYGLNANKTLGFAPRKDDIQKMADWLYEQLVEKNDAD